MSLRKLAHRLAGSANGDIAVYNASTGRFDTLAKGASGTYFRPGPASGNVGYFRQGIWTPPDHGVTNWPWDPACYAGLGTTLTAGRIEGVTAWVPEATTITSLLTYVTVVGATLTAGQCFGAVWQGGTLLAQTVDQAAAWVSTGEKVMAIAGGPVAVAAGAVDIGFWYNGTTSPTFPRNAGVLINTNLSSPNYRAWVADTGRTTTAPGTLGAKSAVGITYWLLHK